MEHSNFEKFGGLAVLIIMIIIAFYAFWDAYSFFPALISIITFILLGIAWFLVPYYLETKKSKKN